MRFPPEPIAGIIILGGSYDMQAGYINTLILHDDTEPVAVVADLAHKYPNAKVIFSGGTSTMFGASGPVEAALAKRFFESVGISPERILVEDKSRNTEENARYSFAMLR